MKHITLRTATSAPTSPRPTSTCLFALVRGQTSRLLRPLLAVSTTGAWDDYVRFFATGLAASAEDTLQQTFALRAVQEHLRERVHRSKLRADAATGLVDLAVARPSFTGHAQAPLFG